MKTNPMSRGSVVVAAGAGAVTFVAIALGGAGLAAALPMSAEEEATARAIASVHALIDRLRQEGAATCPAGAERPVELAALLESTLPERAAEVVTRDGWGRPLLFWCASNDYAVISHGQDGVADEGYLDLPGRAAHDGDDFVLINDNLESAPAHVLTLIEMGRQKCTMDDMRSIGIVLESYRVDHGGLPAPTEGFVPVETLREQVEPVYIRELPLLDGWGRPIMVRIDAAGYRIVSAGRDGTVEQDYSVVEPAGPTGSFDSEIVFGDGLFMQWPEGDQS